MLTNKLFRDEGIRLAYITAFDDSEKQKQASLIVQSVEYFSVIPQNRSTQQYHFDFSFPSP